MLELVLEQYNKIQESWEHAHDKEQIFKRLCILEKIIENLKNEAYLPEK